MNSALKWRIFTEITVKDVGARYAGGRPQEILAGGWQVVCTLGASHEE